MFILVSVPFPRVVFFCWNCSKSFRLFLPCLGHQEGDFLTYLSQGSIYLCTLVRGKQPDRLWCFSGTDVSCRLDRSWNYYWRLCTQLCVFLPSPSLFLSAADGESFRQEEEWNLSVEGKQRIITEVWRKVVANCSQLPPGVRNLFTSFILLNSLIHHLDSFGI